MDDFKIENEDLYEILDITPDSSTSDIKKAYRKKALQCHPDKNPDDPNAGKLFHRLTKILELLTDTAARTAYDRVLKGRKEAVLRHKQLDSKRKKLKEDLEAKERQASSYKPTKSSDQQLKEEIERLRKESSILVEEEVEYIRRKIFEEKTKAADAEKYSKYRIKIKWKASKSDTTNGGYTEELLKKFLSKYGDITAFVISPKKRGSALVEFNTRRAAEMAVELEKGLAENPLNLQWVNGTPSGQTVQSTTIKPSDYESIVFTKLRQAEERKRLIEQMMAEDKNDEV